MNALGWILCGGFLMSMIALIGATTMALPESTRERLILPLVAFSAGSLLGGALLHLIPEAVAQNRGGVGVYLWVLAGFASFLAFEQFLHWHHWHSDAPEVKSPLSHMMVLGDTVHNFLGGLAVAAAFIVDIRLGITTWLVAAAHEVPQELGKYGVLIHGGWKNSRALAASFLSSLTFLLGGILAYVVSLQFNTGFLVPFAAGNFLYIAASDLVPEVNRHHHLGVNLIHFASFSAGIALLLAIQILSGE